MSLDWRELRSSDSWYFGIVAIDYDVAWNFNSLHNWQRG